MEISTAYVLAIGLVIALWLPYAISYIWRGRRADTRGSLGGSRGVTPDIGCVRAGSDNGGYGPQAPLMLPIVSKWHSTRTPSEYSLLV